MDPSFLTYIFLLSFGGLYSLTHIPLDLMMLKNRGKAQYPSPDFSSFTEGFLVVAPSITFWLILFIAPFIYFITNKDILAWHIIAPPIAWAARVTGIVIMSIALILEIFGRIARGKYLSYAEPKLTTKYSYAIMRHPQYTMYMLCFIGLPLITVCPFLLVLLIGIKGYYSLTINEEKALLEQFGTEYTQYMERVGRFIPKIRRKNNY